MRVALVHDYLTQRGGAERVVLSLARAFPGAPLYTSLYDPDGTFPEFAEVDVRTLPLNRLAPLRRHHRLALPLLAPAFSRLAIDADVVICSSSGWAHGAHVDGRKIVYCHAPARWLYQPDRYLRGRHGAVRSRRARCGRRSSAGTGGRRPPPIATSRTRPWSPTRIRAIYGIEAEVVPPPPAITPPGPASQSPGSSRASSCASRGFSRTRTSTPWSSVRASCRPSGSSSSATGPTSRLCARSPARTSRSPAGSSDAELRWLYANCRALVAASYEDFGLTPLEAAAFGKPTAALRCGGFLDTIEEGKTGVFFDEPTPAEIAGGVAALLASDWDEHAIRSVAARFSEAGFIARIRAIAGG